MELTIILYFDGFHILPSDHNRIISYENLWDGARFLCDYQQVEVK